MRYLLASLLLLLLASTASYGQQTQLTGKIIDTLNRKNLQHAVISLIHEKDSLLCSFTRSSANGEFKFPSIAPGEYLILVSHPGFADFFDHVDLKPGENKNLGVVALSLKSRVLEAVIIRSAGAIRIKGDTTEFVADSFKVREGATVEELLKKLPGFQVNSKGEITAQGQRVQKVLVDGEEFFGDDPTMATQNISARAVDKVQVFDTKTDRQQLTGIPTGNDGKTVNIKLKADAKKGGFGKAHFGTDFSKYIDVKALYNRFTGNKKVSAYGTKSDISTGSLNWDEKEKLGIEMDTEYDELNGYYMVFGSSDEFNDWSLKGLPHSYTAGGLYSNKWNDQKNSFNSSYRYNRLATNNTASTLTENILPGLITYRNKYQDTKGLNEQHAINGKYEWKIDSLASIKLVTTGLRKTTNLLSNVYSEFLNSNHEFTNNSTQVINNETERLQNDNQLTYKQMFNKKNRVFMATLRFGITEDKQDAIIQTNTNFFRNNVVDSIDVADQEKKMDGRNQSLGTKLTFSEPLSLKWNMVLDYSYNKNNSYSHRQTYNKSTAGKYENLDPQYSNNFDLEAFSNTGTASFRYMGQKLKMAFGTGLSSVKLNLFDVDSNKHNTYNFLNVTPQASINYTFKPQTTFSINYRGTTRQPGIDQLQPIRENTDRLNIFIGNPDLKVGFNHSISLNFNSFKTLSQRYLFGSVSYNIPVNSIVFYNSIDVTRGKQTYMPVNVNGSRNYFVYFNFFKRRGNKKLNYSLYTNNSGGRNINFVNGQKNATNYLNNNLNFSLSYDNENKFNFSIEPGFGYNSSTSTLYNTFNSNYWNYGGRLRGWIALPKNFEISSDCYINLRQQLQAFSANPNQVNWNAEFFRKVLKDKSGKIYLVINDILNQNIGFTRNITSNFVSEDRFSKVGRYFLLKFEWSFTKMPQTK